MYELHVRVEDDDVVIEARGALDAEARAHLREWIEAAEESGLNARIEPAPSCCPLRPKPTGLALPRCRAAS
ncbi:MAG TPA: hypothetical protein VM938_15440 [Acidimicrobiales bacterium]|nr:hypothetical protein [Acidimicrobiales bacterium]